MHIRFRRQACPHYIGGIIAIVKNQPRFIQFHQKTAVE